MHPSALGRSAQYSSLTQQTTQQSLTQPTAGLRAESIDTSNGNSLHSFDELQKALKALNGLINDIHHIDGPSSARLKELIKQRQELTELISFKIFPESEINDVPQVEKFQHQDPANNPVDGEEGKTILKGTLWLKFLNYFSLGRLNFSMTISSNTAAANMTHLA